MEYQAWNRNKLINEIKKEGELRIKKKADSLFGGWDPSLSFTEESLNSMLDIQLIERYVKLKAGNDPKFKEAHEEDQEKRRFFNQPQCDADYEYWAKHAHWRIDEAIALLLGKDPKRVSWESLKPYLTVSPVAKEFEEIRELARRYVAWKQLYDPVLPGIFLAWAEKMRIDIPDELKIELKKNGIVIADWKDHYDNLKAQHNKLSEAHNTTLKDLKTKDELIHQLKDKISELTSTHEKTTNGDLKETERQSLYKLISVMVVDGYRYNPTDKKSPVPKEISDSMTRLLGEPMHPETVRKWIKKSAEAYPSHA